MRFFKTPSLFPKIFRDLIWSMPASEERVLYLTFDDGPMPGPTDFVLDQLSAYQCQATFFCIGDNIRKHPATFSKILQGGHMAGNHTYHHLNGWACSLEHYRENILLTQQQLPNSPSKPLFRPPFGKLPIQYRKILPGWKIIMWDILTYDFDQNLDPKKALDLIKQNTRPGSIVVFHDSLKAEKNLRLILPEYLQYLKTNGFVMKALA